MSVKGREPPGRTEVNEMQPSASLYLRGKKMQQTRPNTPEPPDWDCDPNERYAIPEADRKLFSELGRRLKKYRLHEDALHQLHFQLSVARMELHIARQLKRLPDQVRQDDQRRAYGAIAKSANTIIEELGELQNIHPQALALSRAHAMVEPGISDSPHEMFGTYLTRLQADLIALTRLTAIAGGLVPSRRAKGPRPEEERNAHFVELVRQLSILLASSKANVREVAVDVWGLYIKGDAITDVQYANKILKRHGPKEKSRT